MKIVPLLLLLAGSLTQLQAQPPTVPWNRTYEYLRGKYLLVDLKNGTSIRPSSVGAALCRDRYAVGYDVVGNKLCGTKSGCDVYIVVVAPKHQILTEEKVLNEVMRFHVTEEVRPQHAPRFRALAPRLGLPPRARHLAREETVR